MITPRFVTVLTFALLLWPTTSSSSSSSSSSFDRPQYICLNEAYPNSWLVNDPSTFTQASIDDLLNNVSNVRGSSVRKLCVSFNLWTMIMSPANETTMLTSLDALLNLVVTNDLPLSISIDPTQWWNSASSLYDPNIPENAYNVEWTGPSFLNATWISWRNWGSQFRMPSPHPNFNSPAFREWSASTVGPLASRIAQWYNALAPSQRYLLAYVRCTQELWIGTNYYYYMNGNALIHSDPKNDPTDGPQKSMQLGYAAICGPGGPGGDVCNGGGEKKLTTAQLDGIVSSFATFAAGLLIDAGIPRSRVMVHTGSFFNNAPPSADTPVFNSPQAAVINNGFPGWSMYTAATSAENDAGVKSALDSISGAPWGAPEWLAFFDRGKDKSLWAQALNATMSYRNNRLIVVQNFQSIADDAGPLGAIIDALNTQETCIVDAPINLSVTSGSNSTFIFSWTLSLPVPVDTRLSLRVSTLSLTLPSAELAVANIALKSLPATAVSSSFTLPQGFDGAEFFVQVVAYACGSTQTMASDAYLVSV
jgi:hypothetical protein